MKICDLHTHSVFSDGTFTPEETIDLAVSLGLSAVALTDHNTVAGLPRFMSYAQDKPIEAVAGVEFSTGYQGQELHILGLFLPAKSYDAIASYVREADQRKEESNLALCRTLCENGYEVDYQRIKDGTPKGKVNRAQIAAALCESGYVASISEAFDTILAPEHGWYVPPERLSALKTMAFIRSIGAVPVWAHPLFHVDRQTCEAWLPVFKAHGLAGIETVYTTYTRSDTDFAREMCRRFGLCESGGSDFHGKNKPDVPLGRGNAEIPYAFCEALRGA